ncbi:MAG: ribosome-binding factor A [Parcubacteria group bacterium]|nr:ribosome-binding factor A [Parcubacteria group bacterium]
MPNQRRLNKVNELIHRFISGLLRRELDVEALVTISSVVTSANGQEATVSITVFPFEKSEAVLKEIQKNIYEFQQALNRGLRMRPVPKIIFKIDESEERGDKILQKIDYLDSN